MTDPAAAWPGDRVPVAAPTATAAFLDGEAVVYLADRAQPVLLNTTAAAVWAAIDGVATVDQIVAALAEAFEADVALVRTDVERTLDTFAQLGLLDL